MFLKVPGSVFLSSFKLPISSDDNSPSVDIEFSAIPMIRTLFKTRIIAMAFFCSIYLMASISIDPFLMPEVLNLKMYLSNHNVKIRRIITIASANIKRMKRLSSELMELEYDTRESPDTTPILSGLCDAYNRVGLKNKKHIYETIKNSPRTVPTQLRAKEFNKYAMIYLMG